MSQFPVAQPGVGSRVERWETNDGNPIEGYRDADGIGWVTVASRAAYRFGEQGPVDATSLGVDPDGIEDTWLRSVLPLVVQARGTQVLHASAVRGPTGVVALCGSSTAGKSTLAAALSSRGLVVLADDALALRPTGASIEALTLPFRLRLRPASMEALELPAIAAEGAGGEVIPLAGLILVEPGADGSAPSLTPVAPVEAVGALMPHAYCFALEEDKPELVSAYARLADGVPVIRFRYPQRIDRLDEVAAALAEAVRGRQPSTSGISARYWLLAARMLGWRLMLPLARRLVSLERQVGWMGAPRRRMRDAARERTAARLAGRLWRSAEGPCLERSLALFRELGRMGAAPELVCGMAHESGALVGHAWVELDGRRLLEPETNEQRFTTVMRFGPDGVLLGPAPS